MVLLIVLVLLKSIYYNHCSGLTVRSVVCVQLYRHGISRLKVIQVLGKVYEKSKVMIFKA